jgi:inner membrane protein involved in colicin E2 resistance
LQCGVRFFADIVHNASGVPFCCPDKPVSYVLAVLKALKWSASLGFFLSLALGYGVVHGSLGQGQWAVIAALSLVSFTAYTGDEVARLSLTNTLR